MVGNSGMLLTRVVYFKENRRKRFALVDAGMTDLMRPALYGAHHEVVPVVETDRETVEVDVAGPVCESHRRRGGGRAVRCPGPSPATCMEFFRRAYSSAWPAGTNRARSLPKYGRGRPDRVIRKRETYEDLTRKDAIGGMGVVANSFADYRS